ncbi:hypothetical protein EVAR_21077_1 [Eumeta japonica]|uniref:Uncharacterized protein n=1 Tax=Eumeta variegata TaxID=151549 RepID=A0A4C1UZW2_EUMVA|nr:hypothetical protein EVAR_21077_1 [Eumeta japonica]
MSGKRGKNVSQRSFFICSPITASELDNYPTSTRASPTRRVIKAETQGLRAPTALLNHVHTSTIQRALPLKTACVTKHEKLGHASRSRVLSQARCDLDAAGGARGGVRRPDGIPARGSAPGPARAAAPPDTPHPANTFLDVRTAARFLTVTEITEKKLSRKRIRLSRHFRRIEYVCTREYRLSLSLSSPLPS